ncbi:MAG: protein kinase [Phycisphaerales bacterium]|nr:protein kinase [Phycisphaerales bacterium]
MTKRFQSGLRVSEYILEECIGTGAFSEVWRARHHVWSDELVAVKLPADPQFARYLQREGVVVHGLRHPNIVRVLGLDPFGDVPYLVMELVRGPSLRGVIEENARGLPVSAVIQVLVGVMNGIAAAHGANVLHRDLKPANVLLDLDGTPVAAITSDRVKLGDFGFGMPQGDALRSIAQSASLDQENKVVGTLAYLAPELRDGVGAPDARGDLYAAGVMLFEMLTGERPAGTELPSTVRAEAPHWLDEIFRRLYARHERRYETAAAVLADIVKAQPISRAVSGAAGVIPPPPPPPGRPVAARVTPTRCPSCSTICDPDDNFCINCGRQLVDAIRRCPMCHHVMGRDDRYCIQCGAAQAGREALA